MKPDYVKSSTYTDLTAENNDKILNSKLLIMGEYRNIKTFLEKFVLQIGLKNFL